MSEPGIIRFKTGDRVMMRYEGRSLPAWVLLASPNGRSLMLGFEAILGGCVGMLPVIDADGDGSYSDIIHGEPVMLWTAP